MCGSPIDEELPTNPILPPYLKKMFIVGVVFVVLFGLLLIQGSINLNSSWDSFTCTGTMFGAVTCVPEIFEPSANLVCWTMGPAIFGLCLLLLALVERYRDKRTGQQPDILQRVMLSLVLLTSAIGVPCLILGIQGYSKVAPYAIHGQYSRHSDFGPVDPEVTGSFLFLAIIGFASSIMAIVSAVIYMSVTIQIPGRRAKYPNQSIFRSQNSDIVVMNRIKNILLLIGKMENPDDDSSFSNDAKMFCSIAFKLTYLYDKINQEHVSTFEFLQPSQYQNILESLFGYMKGNEAQASNLAKISSYIDGSMKRSTEFIPRNSRIHPYITPGK